MIDELSAKIIKEGEAEAKAFKDTSGPGLLSFWPRPFSYLRFRKCQSRVWTNLKLVGAP